MTAAHSAAPTRRRRLVERTRPGRACAGPTCCALVDNIDMRTCPNCGQRRFEPIATILDPGANQPDAEKHTKPAETA